jgi:Flp pilus assembly protein CpaB
MAAHPFGVREAFLAAALVSAPGLPNAALASGQRAVAIAVNLAAIATGGKR